MHFNELQLSGALEEFSVCSLFLVSKMQKNHFFKEEKRLVQFFFIEVRGGYEPF